ncbi:MAG: IS21 family transposase [PVC group bacterium]|nr:IS21 family transposase [PVC group bacterium]
MEEDTLRKQIYHLREVEKLSIRQIARQLNIDRKKISRILAQGEVSPRALSKPILIEPYIQLIAQWYKQYPRLRATQIYQRLKSYGFNGSYPTVANFTKEYRKKKHTAYHTLTFLPGQEAQVDWFFFNNETIGKVAGFVYVLSYSRYAWGMFYPKTTFEFFLDGHLQCFKHLGGLAHSHRYDNLSSVVKRRNPSTEYNPQFLDFASYYGFSIYLCNPGKGNEKGRVERLIRDIRVFLYGQEFSSIEDLNKKFHTWLNQRNNTIHRSTNSTPAQLLKKEKLLGLPPKEYQPTRIIPGIGISKTALVEFETNKYSVPSSCCSQPAQIIAYPDKVEIWVSLKKVASHKRSFNKKQIIRNPLHEEKLLQRSSKFKWQRIYQLIESMNLVFRDFLHNQQDDTQRIETAYFLFKLLKSHSKAMLISAVGELNKMQCFKLKALRSLLNLPQPKDSDILWPKDSHLLNFNYQQRSLEAYDKFT